MTLYDLRDGYLGGHHRLMRVILVNRSHRVVQPTVQDPMTFILHGCSIPLFVHFGIIYIPTRYYDRAIAIINAVSSMKE